LPPARPRRAPRTRAAMYGPAMRVEATSEAVALIRDRGGRLWVWPRAPREKIMPLVSLAASTAPPRGDRSFEPFAAEGFELSMDLRGWPEPEFLEVEVRGVFRKRIEVFWNGRAWLT
jgi:hypothetical protein